MHNLRAMSVRSLRVSALIAVAGVAGLVVVMSGAAPIAASAQGGVDRAQLKRCVKAVLGVGRSATPVSGIADAQVVARFSVFRRTRSPADVLPAVAHLREALARVGATTYDPSAAVRLSHDAGQRAVYAVPATVSVTTLPGGCNRLPQFAGVGVYLALQAQFTGTGSGACLISTQVQEGASSGPSLPGMPPRKPVKALAITQSACESEAVLSGYGGAVGGLRVGAPTQGILIPDGVSALTYTLSDGHQFTVGVAGNLATPPAALSIRPGPHGLTAAELGRQLAAHLPTTVTETGAGVPTATLTRPVALIPDAVRGFSFLRHLLRSGSVVSTSSSSSSTSASCSAQTHRCVAVTITTTCNIHEHCQMTRTIHRYRYVGTKPPRGTTGPHNQPTAPIVGRISRLITHPRKLTLVLTGAPQGQVVVLLSVNCFARNSAAGSGGPPLNVAVPSRTPIALPGPGRAFRACDVSALVTSTQRSRVSVTVARG
jgi:hypothetical protein